MSSILFPSNILKKDFIDNYVIHKGMFMTDQLSNQIFLITSYIFHNTIMISRDLLERNTGSESQSLCDINLQYLESVQAVQAILKKTRTSEAVVCQVPLILYIYYKSHQLHSSVMLRMDIYIEKKKQKCEFHESVNCGSFYEYKYCKFNSSGFNQLIFQTFNE